MSSIKFGLPAVNQVISKPFNARKKRPEWLSKLRLLSIAPSSSIDLKCAAKADEDEGEGDSHFIVKIKFDGVTRYFWTGTFEGKKIFVTSISLIEKETQESRFKGDLGDCFIERFVFLEEWAQWDKAIQILSYLFVIKNILLGLNVEKIIVQDWIMKDYVMNTLLLMGFEILDRDFVRADDSFNTLIFRVKMNLLYSPGG